MRAHLLDLLYALDGVRQDPDHHPEGCALTHSLQVFEVARRRCSDPDLITAALLHDVGKSVDLERHAEIGADDLRGIVSPRAEWLIRHHMLLLHAPRRTRRRFRGRRQLADLELLRRFDLAGRAPSMPTLTVEDALELCVGCEPHVYHGGCL